MRSIKNIAIIQARMASTRFSDKVLRPFCNGYNLLDYCLHNVSKAKGIDSVHVATTTKPEDDKIENYCQGKALIYRGSEDNVMKRFVDIIDSIKPDYIIRVCADNPFLIREGIEHLVSHHAFYDYTTYTINQIPAMLLPTGLFVECVTANALKRLYKTARSIEKEHVTYGFYNRKDQEFSCNFIDVKKFCRKADNCQLRFSVDTKADFHLVDSLIEGLNLGLDIDLNIFSDIMNYVDQKDLLKNMIEENGKQGNLKKYDL